MIKEKQVEENTKISLEDNQDQEGSRSSQKNSQSQLT